MYVSAPWILPWGNGAIQSDEICLQSNATRNDTKGKTLSRLIQHIKEEEIGIKWEVKDYEMNFEQRCSLDGFKRRFGHCNVSCK